MTEFSFDTGKNGAVLIDGQVAGGIFKAVCTDTTQYECIYQAFTDVPVHRVGINKHLLQFYLNKKNSNPFGDGYLEKIDIVCGEKTYAYSGCWVMKTESVINGCGAVEDVVQIVADRKEEL